MATSAATPQRSVSAPNATASPASSTRRVPSRWDGRRLTSSLMTQRTYVVVSTSSGSLSGSSPVVPTATANAGSMSRRMSSPMGVRSGLLLNGPSRSSRSPHGSVSVPASCAASTAGSPALGTRGGSLVVQLPKVPEFEPPMFLGPLPVPESPDAEQIKLDDTCTQMERKHFGAWPCEASNSCIPEDLGPGESNLENLSTIGTSCPNTGESSELSSFREARSSSPEKTPESALPSYLSSCWSYHSSKLVDSCKPSACQQHSDPLPATPVLLTEPFMKVEVTDDIDAISASEPEPEDEVFAPIHKSSQEVQNEDAAKVDGKGSCRSRSRSASFGYLPAEGPADIRYIQPLVVHDLASPWTPLWSRLETAAPTPTPDAGTVPKDSGVETISLRFVEWFASEQQSAAPPPPCCEKVPAFVQKLTPLNLDALAGAGRMQPAKQVSPSCGSTCSYSSSEGGSSDVSHMTDPLPGGRLDNDVASRTPRMPISM